MLGSCEPPCRCWKRTWAFSQSSRPLNQGAMAPAPETAFFWLFNLFLFLIRRSLLSLRAQVLAAQVHCEYLCTIEPANQFASYSLTSIIERWDEIINTCLFWCWQLKRGVCRLNLGSFFGVCVLGRQCLMWPRLGLELAR